MHTAEIAGLAQVRPQAALQFPDNGIGIPFQLFGTILGELRDGGLGRIPVTGAVLVQIRCGAGKTPQGIPEYGGGFLAAVAVGAEPM